MLSLLIGWQWVAAFFSATLLPLLKKIPWQVWLALGLAIVFMVYGGYRERKGYAKCEAVTREAAIKERGRQEQIAKQELAKVLTREQEARERLDKTTEQIDALNKQVAELKTAKNVCLPKHITDGIRRLR